MTEPRSDPATPFPEELLSGYLDGALTQQEEQRVSLHVEGSPQARALLAELAALRQASRTTDFEPVEDRQWCEAPRTPGSAQEGAQVIVVTTPQIEGKRIVRVLGLVRGNTVRARHIGRDIMATLRNVVGGEIAEYTKLLAESREQSVDRMCAEATSLGANAIVEARFSTSMVMSLAAELLAYGTAVVIEDEPSAARR